ncbi:MULTISPECIES: thiosulfate sulfurtransferase GlpE [Pseudoalteromonas]|uniref:Thiosulfate sulfurtransferase GlpE n=1 Tax=Pseudoalteromonas qingdaonensis TaxID=3131913 RepID=A0ABU9MT87_9GAMM|nr:MULTISPECIES: thiosulfate sulfurtransferase GlpE [unclassified Pseudoalteromonas]MBS3798304.1 thiosulfate sulfurtransferase GlpE [Pseudoalteromonas sp. BDTF-M6]
MAYKHISVAQTQALLNDENVVIADIRDPNSFAAGHIPKAEHLSNSNIGEFMLHKEYDQPIIVVCYHGISSQGAAGYLAEQGFDDVYTMDGGFSAWATQFPELVEK